MRDIIAAEISRLEKEEDIRIIHAVESGSRAWGFESPDNDYDVRFVYVRPVDYYLKLEDAHDVIASKVNNTWDLSGWDVTKALRLLHGSNPTLFEWSRSPIVYQTTPDWEGVRDEIDQHFSVKSGLRHYLSLANRTYREQIQRDTVQLKQYFYVLRPLLASLWILNRQTPPPMPFTDLAAAELEPAMRPIVSELLIGRMSSPEGRSGPRLAELDDYIERQVDAVRTSADTLPDDDRADWASLNEVFLTILEGH